MCVQVSTLLTNHPAQLGRHGDAARCGECLTDVSDGELTQRALVHQLRIGAQRKDEHHVGQVDRLPPRTRSHLHEPGIDDDHPAVPDHQVGGFDVAMRDAGIPQASNHTECVVDDLDVDLGVTDLHRAGHELHDEQVFPAGHDLDEAERRRAEDPGAMHDGEVVILLLHQAAHRVERRLVLELSVQQLAAELVPAVGSQMRLGHQLGQQLHLRLSGDPHPQRSRRGRSGQPDRGDGLHVHTELLLQSAPDRITALAGHVQVSPLALPVRDREDVVRGEEAKRRQRDRDSHRHPDQHVGRRVQAERHPGDADDRDDHRRDDLPDVRSRPLGTRVYRIPINAIVSVATGSEGVAQPPQPPSIWTPNGRGRCVIMFTTVTNSPVTLCTR